MLDRWRDLDHGQRRVLTVLGSLIVVVALISVVVSFTSSGSSHDAVRTAGSSTTSSPEVTTTTAADGAVNATSTSTARSASGSTKGSTTTSVRGGTTTTLKGSGSTKGTTSTTAKGVTATTIRPTTSTTARTIYVAGACNPGGGAAAANDIANLFCAYRANQGLATMSRNSGLDQEAQAWAQHMADQAAAGADPTTVLAHNLDPTTGYKAAVLADCSRCNGWAENVAYDTSAANAWNDWLGSAGHLADIRGGTDGGEYGVGAASGGGFIWFVQDFGRYP